MLEQPCDTPQKSTTPQKSWSDTFLADVTPSPEKNDAVECDDDRFPVCFHLVASTFIKSCYDQNLSTNGTAQLDTNISSTSHNTELGKETSSTGHNTELGNETSSKGHNTELGNQTSTANRIAAEIFDEDGFPKTGEPIAERCNFSSSTMDWLATLQDSDTITAAAQPSPVATTKARNKARRKTPAKPTIQKRRTPNTAAPPCPASKVAAAADLSCLPSKRVTISAGGRLEVCVFVEDPGVNAAIKPLIRVYCFSCKSSTIPRFPEFAKALKDRIKPGRTKQEAVYIYKHLLIDHGDS